MGVCTREANLCFFPAFLESQAKNDNQECNNNVPTCFAVCVDVCITIAYALCSYAYMLIRMRYVLMHIH